MKGRQELTEGRNEEKHHMLFFLYTCCSGGKGKRYRGAGARGHGGEREKQIRGCNVPGLARKGSAWKE